MEGDDVAAAVCNANLAVEYLDSETHQVRFHRRIRTLHLSTLSREERPRTEGPLLQMRDGRRKTEAGSCSRESARTTVHVPSMSGISLVENIWIRDYKYEMPWAYYVKAFATHEAREIRSARTSLDSHETLGCEPSLGGRDAKAWRSLFHINALPSGDVWRKSIDDDSSSAKTRNTSSFGNTCIRSGGDH